MNTNIQLAPNVIVIPPSIAKAQEKKRKKLRVAAYCRVSTDEEDQLMSYENQMSHYTALIEKNPEWKCAGIFADEGKSGVRTKKRDEFLRMIELCRAGKIDKIITKSLSRFARNTVDTLNYIRELKVLRISIFFEKEGIDTMEIPNEMILTILSAFSQGESESISGNITMGKRMKFKAGQVPMMYGNVLGYRKGADGKPEIVPEEATVIKFIYNKFLEGNSYMNISRLLQEKGYKTKKGNAEWSVCTIKGILQNEKYKGDVILQKTFVVDLFNKVSKRNEGELPMYLVKNHHIPIIEPEIFDRVQIEIARRNSIKSVTDKGLTQNSKYSSKYALTGIVECGECGAKYRRTTWSKRGVKKVVWRCISRLEYGPKYCQKSPSIEESRIHNGIVKAINTMLDNTDELKTILYGTIAEVLAISNADKEIIDLKTRIDEKNADIMRYIDEGVTQRKARDDIESYCKNRHLEINELQEKLNAVMARNQLEKLNRNYMTEIYEHISKIEGRLVEYNDTFTRMAVTKVKILSEEKIEVTLYGSVVMTVDI